MQIRLADYIASHLADCGITQLFSVVGGGAMHLNNAFAMERRINVVYNHHEQACVIAAESYSRIDNKIAAVCVTSGPGGTNAITGLLCAWQDNRPLIVISGQVRRDTTVDSTGLSLRQFGEQEYYITRSVEPLTQYSVMVTDPLSIRYHIDKAIYLATTGRCGPVWIDVPLDVQATVIETDELKAFNPRELQNARSEVIDYGSIIKMIKAAERPVFIAGSGVRMSGALSDFTSLVTSLDIPLISPTSIVDYYTKEDAFYYGMFGGFGGRCGNFIVQNADLIVAFAARMSFKQIGFNYEAFSPTSKKIVIDIDPEELRKPTLKIDIPVCADVKAVIQELCKADLSPKDNEARRKWSCYCNHIKENYYDGDYTDADYITAKHYGNSLMKKLAADSIVVVGNNTAAVSIMQAGIKKHGQRIYGNVNCGTMGYDLPAAIGAAIARGGEAYCATGEGSLMMNLQELQTVAHYGIPVKLIIFNNNSYQAIVNTQNNFFDGYLAGCTPESGVSFPSFEKIADAFNLQYMSISKASEMEDGIDWIIGQKGAAILDVIQTGPDPIMPKSSGKQLPDGTIVSTPIDDLAPFLDRDTYEAAQYENWARRWE